MAGNQLSTEGSLDVMVRQRYIHLVQSLIGKSCKYFLSDGSTVTGCFSTATPNPHAPDNVRNRYIIKGITSTSDSSRFQLNGSAVIAFDKVVMVVCESVQTGVHAKDEFKTDTEISKMRVKDNELVSAGSEWLSAGDGGLEENSHKTGSWDQFTANESKFGVKTTFDENLYTTKLNNTKISDDDRRRAEKLAKEINSSSNLAGNMHVMEERGFKVEGDYDEEDLYSGVLVQGKDRKGLKKADLGTGDDVEVQVTDEKETTPPAPAPSPAPAPAPAPTPTPAPAAANKEEKPVEEKPKSTFKLKATAKEFSFNPGVKAFVPGGAPAPPPQGFVPPQPMPMGGPGFSGGYNPNQPQNMMYPQNSQQMQQQMQYMQRQNMHMMPPNMMNGMNPGMIMMGPNGQPMPMQMQMGMPYNNSGRGRGRGGAGRGRGNNNGRGRGGESNMNNNQQSPKPQQANGGGAVAANGQPPVNGGQGGPPPPPPPVNQEVEVKKDDKPQDA
ncbi:hypothetical protein TL16_g02303 [Triparma laevis f. inornata]|uniref:LsmAD domain-containing protein n=1 Tax=Triparma laevis f. inornata TaxID=1714386 RepID=A0A9W6ZSB1_9STRA|nr:hypothetical protein TL16_g02303 [Triparma laevis f. inornata]